MSLEGSLMPVRSLVATISLALTMAGAVQAAPSTSATANASVGTGRALDLAERAIALRSVAGPGNQTPQVAALYKAALLAGGYADQEHPADQDAPLALGSRANVMRAGRVARRCGLTGTYQRNYPRERAALFKSGHYQRKPLECLDRWLTFHEQEFDPLLGVE
jgi:hypothetical protein